MGRGRERVCPVCEDEPKYVKNFPDHFKTRKHRNRLEEKKSLGKVPNPLSILPKDYGIWGIERPVGGLRESEEAQRVSGAGNDGQQGTGTDENEQDGGGVSNIFPEPCNAGLVPLIRSAFLRLGASQHKTPLDPVKYPKPELILASECWKTGRPQPTANSYIDRMFKTWHSPNRGGSKAEFRLESKPTNPEDKHLPRELIQQLHHPDPVSPVYMFNHESNKELRVPARLPGPSIVNPQETLINITPRYSYVAPHSDGGEHVVATVLPYEVDKKRPSEETVFKIWALWPPTPQNLKVLGQSAEAVDADGPDSFINADSEDFEHGVILYQKASDAVLVGNWIHATYTLRPCIVPALQYIRKSDLDVHMDIVKFDADAYGSFYFDPLHTNYKLHCRSTEGDTAQSKMCSFVRGLEKEHKKKAVTWMKKGGQTCIYDKAWSRH